MSTYVITATVVDAAGSQAALAMAVDVAAFSIVVPDPYFSAAVL